MALFGFGKKKENTTKEVESTIKVLGGGCAKCNELEAATVAALTELGMDASVEHVTDFSVIATYGVMSTPALVIDGKVVSMGKVLKKNEVITILQEIRPTHIMNHADSVASDSDCNTEKPQLKCEGKPKVAFVCNHNSCRSQIAEALGKALASDVFDSYSAGTIIKNQINQDAVRIMKEVHHIDMEETQFNKTIHDIPQPDVVIFMGCNVSCPALSFQYTENWGLDDPSGLSDDVFKHTIDTIYQQVLHLKEKLS